MKLVVRLLRYLVRFDCSSQLRGQEDVSVRGRVIHVDQHSARGVRPVQGVVDVRAARLALLVLVGGLAADVDDGVVLGRAHVDHVWRGRGDREQIRGLKGRSPK